MSGHTERTHVDAAFCLTRLRSLRRLPAQTKSESYYLQTSGANVTQRVLYPLHSTRTWTYTLDTPSYLDDTTANTVKPQGS